MGSAAGPWRVLGLCAAWWAPAAFAVEDPGVVDQVVVTADRWDESTEPSAASAGVVLDDQIANRPLLRAGELLEVVPGLIVTQHSGDGKANQYFLRGFNLDHGTDFATSVDGIPVNMPTHAHGQGYTDLNFVIPELVDHVAYRKGPYYSDQGDFSAAGAANITLKSRLDQDLVTGTVGQYGYERLLAAGSRQVGSGSLLLALQGGYEDGPWVLPEAYRKFTGLIRYSASGITGGYSLEGIAYTGRWDATDQIPLRAVDAGLITRFGYIDPTDGADTHRYSVGASGWRLFGPATLRANVYTVDYFLDLYSDFTYFENPVHGDQFEQYDQRRVYGGEVSWQQPVGPANARGTLSAGIQARNDNISPVALYDTTDRVRWKTISATRVSEASYSAYLVWSAYLTPRSRVELGARVDDFTFRVNANVAANSGRDHEAMASPKASLVVGPWHETEYYVNFGTGFHSNDARGTTITVDPNDGVTPVAKVSPLARAIGGEAGVRTKLVPNLQLSTSVWMLNLKSELTLNDDGSTIVPSGATRRYGVEFSAIYRPGGPLVVDADLAWTHARYEDTEAAGQYLPNSLPLVASLGASLDRDTGWFGGARVRYFASAPVTQDDVIRSRPSLLVSVNVGYHVTRALAAGLSVYNVGNRPDYDIEYYYASQLRGEAAPVPDVHFHPTEPRTVRATLTYRF
jgi:TonB dependent receptor/TonB-dependent Receptor Plug Domain